MVETTRRHERLPDLAVSGTRFTIEGVLPRPVHVFVPEPARALDAGALLVHFHGAAYVAEQAAAAQSQPFIAAVVNLGAGSGVYERAFSDPRTFGELRRRIAEELSQRRGAPVALDDIVLTGFSAGCAAIREILRDPAAARAVRAVVLLDGIHTSYVPDGQVLAEGGALDSARFESLVRFARLAIAGEKHMLVTHSEIFPGTFASTTETADWMLRTLGLERTAVVEWGPGGMQRLSLVERAGFRLEGYAGNTAPDHIDHLHALPALLSRLGPR
jgi:hypothetical protein